ncbi:PulJ/GspJ family protein [Agrococcus baldri]|uniref:Prepilin-type N-terminal cleavage/methylation domain-containing protein n=1 Tax=Agrococcus baldri TaxID=153730 RepID=A0AA87USU1_9MICO|nr:type II secretion system protein [Agrococcus baldri]GEK80999.1 hypothetical protein ABA31_23500 [Agrococcus baldri]
MSAQRLAAGRERERGMTLIELLVAISLLAVAMTLLTSMVVSASRTFTQQETQQDSTNRAAIAMRSVTQVIRGGTELELSSTWQPAPVFSTARPDSLTMNTYVGVDSTDEGPTRVTLTVDAARGELVETRFASSRAGGVWVYSTTPSRTRVLAYDVSSSAPFSYLRADSTALPSRALSETERREIAAVRVTLAVQSVPGSDASPAELVSVVSLPNLDITRTGA